VLADVLLHRRQGNRPVTLIGTSLGAKVIYECLLHLSEMQRKDHGKHDCGKYRGIVENIYLLGAPISPTDKELRVIHSLVSGRIVNGYCKNDWVLGFLLRAMGRPWGIAGMAPITIDQTPSPSRIENIDLTDLVSGHSGYMDPNVMHRVLDRCFVNTT
jgi:hypothetical protein